MSNQERKHQIPAAMCLFESSMIEDVKSQNDRSNQIMYQHWIETLHSTETCAIKNP